jgi:hypothetical protein
VTERPLKVGLLTSWNTQCGIAEYSRGLAEALRRRGDVEVRIFGSRNVGERAVRDYAEGEFACFDVQAWREDKAFRLDAEPILEAELDVLHIQYSNLFYERRQLVHLMRRFPGVIALTYHDKVIGRVFPWRIPDVLFAHREDVGAGPRRLIPQGIDLRPPVVKTFGLGGKAESVPLLEAMCERNGWRFERSYGRHRWLETHELRAWLRDSDAIVLWYPDMPTSGGSASVAVALGTRRPVFVNEAQAFSDLPRRTTNLRKVATLEELEVALRAELFDPYVQGRSWDAVAETTVNAYHEALTELRGDRHGGARLRARTFAACDPKPRTARSHRRA